MFYDHGYIPLVVNTSRSFPHSWLITRFVTRLTRRVWLMEQELLTLPEHQSSPLVFSGVRVTRSLVLCVCFVDRCLSFYFWLLCCLLFFNLRLLITPLVSSNSSVNTSISNWMIDCCLTSCEKQHTLWRDGDDKNVDIKFSAHDSFLE